MRMKSVKLNECEEGDVLAESIVNRHGAIIIAGNTFLNNYILNRLSQLEIKKIKIYDGCDGEESCDYRQVADNYMANILGFKSILNELASSKMLNSKKVVIVSDSVYRDIYNSSYIFRLLNEEKSFDEYTYTHSLNVAFYAMLIGKWMSMDEESIKIAIKVGLLHDIGKTKVPIEILNKRGKLTDEEFAIIKRHSHFGYEIVKSTDSFSDEVCEAILSHHEREDKSGYPFGIGSRQINMFAKMIAVADVYDAMTSERVYKKRSTPFEVFEMFNTIGMKDYDPKIVKIFLTNLTPYFIGSKVLLNTGEIGEIVFIPLQSITEPIIKIGHDYIDLAQNSEKKIASLIANE